MSNDEIKKINDNIVIRMENHHCNGCLYEKFRTETTNGTLIIIRCNKCNFYDYIKIPVDFSNKNGITS